MGVERVQFITSNCSYQNVTSYGPDVFCAQPDLLVKLTCAYVATLPLSYRQQRRFLRILGPTG
jgi:hypothetical protein